MFLCCFILYEYLGLCNANLEPVLIQGDAYQMLVHIFVGSLLPYIEGLDSWLFEGTLDDPFEEVILI